MHYWFENGHTGKLTFIASSTLTGSVDAMTWDDSGALFVREELASLTGTDGAMTSVDTGVSFERVESALALDALSFWETTLVALLFDAALASVVMSLEEATLGFKIGDVEQEALSDMLSLWEASSSLSDKLILPSPLVAWLEADESTLLVDDGEPVLDMTGILLFAVKRTIVICDQIHLYNKCIKKTDQNTLTNANIK